MSGSRLRILLIALSAACLCDYGLSGRTRGKPTINHPRPTPNEKPAIEPTAGFLGGGMFGRGLPGNREQETTIRRPQQQQQYQPPVQVRQVEALSADKVLSLVNEAIAKTERRYLDVAEYTPWQIMHGLLALRRDYKLKSGGQLVSAVDFISNGPKFRGEDWWEKTVHGGRGHPYSVPYAFEGHINQFPALLCMTALPLDHQLKAKGGVITVADIVRNAQMTVNANEEISWTLWFLTQYIAQDTEWVNQHNQAWSMAELVRIQVAAPVNEAPCGGTHGLFALAFARNAYLRDHGQLRGVWMNAEFKLRQHIELARQLQNADGSFSSNWFKGRGYTADFKERIKTSGHMLEWLMMALPTSRLNEPWVHRAVQCVANDLIRNATAPAECGPMYHALHALVLYRERVAPASTAPQSQDQLAQTAPASPAAPAQVATPPKTAAVTPQPKTTTPPVVTPVTPAPSAAGTPNKSSSTPAAGTPVPTPPTIAGTPQTTTPPTPPHVTTQPQLQPVPTEPGVVRLSPTTQPMIAGAPGSPAAQAPLQTPPVTAPAPMAGSDARPHVPAEKRPLLVLQEPTTDTPDPSASKAPVAGSADAGAMSSNSTPPAPPVAAAQPAAVPTPPTTAASTATPTPSVAAAPVAPTADDHPVLPPMATEPPAAELAQPAAPGEQPEEHVANGKPTDKPTIQVSPPAPVRITSRPTTEAGTLK